jgi:hypothetical protein
MPQALAAFGSNFNGGAVDPNDVYAFGPTPGVAFGDIITLNAGTVTTMNNFAAPAPAGGSFGTIITDAAGGQLSPGGVAVPEPAASGLIMASLSVLGFLRYRYRAR